MARITACCAALLCLVAVHIVSAVAAQDARDDAPRQAEGQGWRDIVTVLRIGVMTGRDIQPTKARLEPFRAHVEAMIGLPVEIIPHRDWKSLILAQSSGRVDYSLLSAGAYAGVWAVCECLEPLVVGETADGATGYHAILVTRADADIDTLDDLKDKRVLFTRKGSTAGHLVPTAEFRASGFDPKNHFGAFAFAGDAERGIGAVLAGEADAAMTWSSLTGKRAAGYNRGALTHMVARGKLDMAAIDIVWRSRPIPNPPHAVRSSLPEGLKALLRRTLTRLDADNPLAFDAVDISGSVRFVEIRHEAFRVLIDVAGGRQRTSPGKG